MDFHEDMREVSIAMVSTSALLLTILAVVHITFSGSVFLAVLTVFGLYMTIGLGVVEFLALISASREERLEARRTTHRMVWRLFFFQVLMFVLGLLGISLAVIVASVL